MKEYGTDAVEVLQISFSPDSSMLVSRTFLEVILWDVKTSQKLLSLRHHPHVVTGSRFHQSGNLLLSKGSDLTLRSSRTGKELRVFSGEAGKALITFVPFQDGKRIVGANEDTLFIWDVNTGKLLKKMSTRGYKPSRYFQLDVSPNQKWIALGGEIWDASSYEFIKTLDTGGDVRFSPDSSMFASGFGIWRTSDWSLQHNIRTDNALAWMSNITLLTVNGGTFPPNIKFWDTRTGKVVHEVEPSPYARFPNVMAVSPTGEYLAVGGLKSGYIVLWRCQPRKEPTAP